MGLCGRVDDCTDKHIQAIQSTCQTRNAFCTGEVANDEHAPARVDYEREDGDVSGLPLMPGQYKHTEYLRRLFVRGKPFEADPEFEELTYSCPLHHMPCMG